MRRAALALLALTLLTRPVLAADVVGQAVVDGKVVDLMSDGHWVYHEPMVKPMARDQAMAPASDAHDDHAADAHSDDHGKAEDHAMESSEQQGHDAGHDSDHEEHAKDDHAEADKGHAMKDDGEDHAMKDDGEDHAQDDHAMNTAFCEDVTEGVAFCGHLVWTAVDTEGSAADAAFRHPQGVFSQIIVEEVGRADGLDLEAIRETILSTAANAMGGAPEDVNLLDLTKAEIDGREAASLIYHGEIGGVEVVFANTVLLMDQKTLQAVTIAAEDTLSDRHRAAHAGFLADLRVVE